MTQEAEGNFALALNLGLFVQIGQLVLQILTLSSHYEFHLNGGVRTSGSDNQALFGVLFRTLILR